MKFAPNFRARCPAPFILLAIAILGFTPSAVMANCTETQFKNVYSRAKSHVRVNWQACDRKSGRRTHSIEAFGRCGKSICSLGRVSLRKISNKPPFFKGRKRDGGWTRRYFVQRWKGKRMRLRIDNRYRGGGPRRDVSILKEVKQPKLRNVCKVDGYHGINTKYYNRVQIRRCAYGKVKENYVRVLVKCRPKDCDWGWKPLRQTQFGQVAVFDHGFVKRTVTISKPRKWLKVAIRSNYRDARPTRSSYAFYNQGVNFIPPQKKWWQ